MDTRDDDLFISRRLSSNSSYNSTDQDTYTVDYHCLYIHVDVLIWHMRGTTM